ncbi:MULTISPECIES: metallophosphoesterase family protein [Oxalobacteraceae]|jgi:diadenosine tetraphosphatase ApaH/serine/threonine PP2A family protein phosphatase|uniref:metallophosphoesterase family protein n=1 Tax=Oxalobacteraceae TaxID=75682 RepID=UPI0010A545B8|nr:MULTISPECIES: metallophosphoesterase family protein [Oxalobacteraceae]HJV52230.1 metallophosphoesterase family protein [Noviherbaspirillum sp.]
MLIAVLTDIHANREALAACLAHAEERKAQRYAFLGDLVGYGADPGWVVDTVMDYVERGAFAVLGNHDVAVTQAPSKHMNPQAREVVEWTRAQLNEKQLKFLEWLPLTHEWNNCLFVHATAAEPRSWEYVAGTLEAIKSMYATRCRITFCGHVHEPALYNLSPTGKVSSFVPTGDSSIPLGTQRRWLVIPGSVGQPRDGNPAACYALFDDVTHELIYFRVPYDYETTAAKIREAGLPQSVGNRLEHGR